MTRIYGCFHCKTLLLKANAFLNRKLLINLFPHTTHIEQAR